MPCISYALRSETQVSRFRVQTLLLRFILLLDAGMLVTKAIQNRQRKRKQDPCGMLVDAWNNVSIRIANTRIPLSKSLTASLVLLVPPDRHHQGHSSSSSSSEDERDTGNRGAGGRCRVDLQSRIDARTQSTSF
ncbi:hypothetical protein OE88DRAFT_1657606 [Heliocybe sulcata]|uniref:Uncharacterized protein n=1 Tax=Heliocybe sulcata TaxID=5364 RepID=A0A5C3N5Q5_9AGAM|nr:hypothetical protein OE88DRAFT_1657606 [Heliocybe sulcata]